MKRFLILLTLFLAFTLKSGAVSAETPKAQEEVFSTKGKLTEVNPEEKFLRLKNEGGLELTFLVVAITRVQVGDQQKLVADLSTNDPVEIEYTYNENYEKVIRSIKKEAAKVSPT